MKHGSKLAIGEKKLWA